MMLIFFFFFFFYGSINLFKNAYKKLFIHTVTMMNLLYNVFNFLIKINLLLNIFF